MTIELYQTPQTHNQWLSVGSQGIHRQLSSLLNEINRQFTKVNPIVGWSLNDPEKSHITLYMGWDSELDKNLQSDLLERIKDAINNKTFTLEINRNNSTISINDNYVILNVGDDNLSKLQKKIQKTTKKFIDEKGIPKNESWFDKKYNPHISLGTIDYSFRSLSKLKGKFRGNWRENLLNNYLIQPIFQKVNSIELLGVNDPILPKEEKEYYLLGRINFEESNEINEEFYFPYQKKHLIKRLNKISKTGHIINVQVKNNLNQYTNTKEASIYVTFDNKNDAMEILNKAKSGKIYHEDGHFMIKLGKNCLKNLFPSKGKQIYRDIVTNSSFEF